MTNEDLIELRQYTETIKEVDLKSTNKSYIIDFDIFMHKVLLKYKLILGKT